ncbi:MAG: methyltransferase domain-containing protein [Alphaproteobacteria bacterium]
MSDLRSWGETASFKYQDALALFQAGDHEQAAVLLKGRLSQDPDKYGYFALGQVQMSAKDYARAALSLLEAVKIDKFYHEAYVLLGDLYIAHKQPMAAIEAYGQAVAVQPENEMYKQKLVDVVSTRVFKKTGSNLKGVLIECLESHEIEMINMGAAWLSMIARDASVGPYYKLSKHKTYEAFKKAIARFDRCDGLIDPFFLTGLGKFIVADPDFERWIKYLRRYVLESVVAGVVLFSDEIDIDLMTCALSRYCFLTDYVMSASSEEQALLEALEARINDAGLKPLLCELACYGCYNRLHTLPKAKDIAAGLEGGNHVSQIPKSQIEDFFAQQEIAGEIKILGSIDDEVSRAVQEQYETFPYPRWDVAAKDLFDPEIEGYLKGQSAEILNAGCGTGREAIQLAFAFPDAYITAVDLSKTSLAYAVFKARQLGIENIDFYQADIMGLGGLEGWCGRFDYIASAGVLHHMSDPVAGWQVLNEVLKEGGLMRIGLYSRHARWALSQAHQVIKEQGFGSDVDSIKAFRDTIDSHLKHKVVKNIQFSSDYYNLSTCRDLLFHVQEHQFDLLRIKTCLDELGLTFEKFYLGNKVLEKYKRQNAKHDPEGKDLERWDHFETKNPDTFAGMYRFWCKKRLGADT